MGKMKNLSIDMIEQDEWQGYDRIVTIKNVEDTLSARGDNYGQYTNVSSTAQKLKNVLRSAASWDNMEPYMQESLDMICNKLARICNGNPFYEDSWHDIAGYARLVETELEKIK